MLISLTAHREGNLIWKVAQSGIHRLAWWSAAQGEGTERRDGVMGEKLRAGTQCLLHPLPLCPHWRSQSPPPLPEEDWESQLWLAAKLYELDCKREIDHGYINNRVPVHPRMESQSFCPYRRAIVAVL